MTAILATERLRLRELEAADAPFILELVNEPAFIANVRDSGVRDLDQARGYIENGPRASYAAHGFGLWLVEAKGGGEPLGVCGLLRRDDLDDPDLGFALLERHWGRGYAREAAAATLAYAKDVLAMARVLAITAPHNEASVRLLTGLGFAETTPISLPGAERASRLFVWSA
jgi:[ribosomal protein S5]-alanine N-acetyltransferase